LAVCCEQLQEKLTDSAHRSLADHLTASRMDDVLSYPDRLSEEIVKCISCIYCKFANPKILATKGLSVSSTSSLSSSSTFSPRNLSGSWSSHHNEESTEQYEFEVCKDDNRPYSTMIEILKICLDDDSFNYATTMLHKFRLFTTNTSSSNFDILMIFLELKSTKILNTC